MSKSFVEIDASPWLNANGTISTDVFFGETCEPAYTKSLTFEDLIDKELESFIIAATGKIAEHHTDQAKELIESLKRAVEFAERRVEELS